MECESVKKKTGGCDFELFVLELLSFVHCGTAQNKNYSPSNISLEISTLSFYKYGYELTYCMYRI